MDFQAGDVFTFPFFLKGRLYDDDDSAPANGLINFYSDNGVQGKDGGDGFISDGNSRVSNIDNSTPLSIGAYEIPIKLKVTIV